MKAKEEHDQDLPRARERGSDGKENCALFRFTGLAKRHNLPLQGVGNIRIGWVSGLESK